MRVFQKSRIYYIKSKVFRPVMVMKFPSWLPSKGSDLRRAEHLLKNSEHIQLQMEAGGTQQNSSQASAGHSGSNTFKNYQIYCSLCEEWDCGECWLFHETEKLWQLCENLWEQRSWWLNVSRQRRGSAPYRCSDL